MIADEDICRVCRCSSTQRKPLYYPCSCTGSVKYVHQQCLEKWLAHSKKSACEICGYKFKFIPIYSENAPDFLNINDLFEGVLKKIIEYSGYFFNYIVVFVAWLIVLPLFSYRFSYGSFFLEYSALYYLPTFQQLYLECAKGYLVTGCCLISFIGFLWLKDQANSHISSIFPTDDHSSNPSNIENEIPNNHEEDLLIDHGNIESTIMNDYSNNVSLEISSSSGSSSSTITDVVPNYNGTHESENSDDDVVISNGALALNPRNNVNRWNDIDISFEQFFGLDGSSSFIENIFWIICLNSTSTILIGAIPFHLGRFISNSTNLIIPNDPFGILITLFVGYLPIIILTALFSYLIITKKSSFVFKYIYIIMKIILIIIMEIGLLPMIVGAILNVNSLKLFGATLEDRINLLIKSPGSSIVVHWLIGMFYIFYVALFFVLMKEAFRPGIFYFLKHLNDPNFSLIQQIIQKPFLKQVFSFIKAIFVIFLFILSTIGLPVIFIDKYIPGVFPYIFSWKMEATSLFLPLELLIIHIVIPALIDNSATKSWIRGLVCIWGLAVSKLLNIESYLLGTVDITNMDNINVDLSRPWPSSQPLFRKLLSFSEIISSNNVSNTSSDLYSFQPFVKSNYFSLRLFLLIMIGGLTLSFLSILMFVIPITIGRLELNLIIGQINHDSYTSIIGMYNIVSFFHLIGYIISLRDKFNYQEYRNYFIKISQIFIHVIIFMVFIPNLFGIIFQKIVLIPLYAPFKQCSIYIWWIEWAFGLLLTKTLLLCVLIGPECEFQRLLNQIQSNGLFSVPLKIIMNTVAFPICSYLIGFVTLPNFLVELIRFYHLDSYIDERMLLLSHLLALIILMITVCIVIILRRSAQICEQIKNEKYLIGFKLVNKDLGTFMK